MVRRRAALKSPSRLPPVANETIPMRSGNATLKRYVCLLDRRIPGPDISSYARKPTQRGAPREARLVASIVRRLSFGLD